MRFFSLQIFIIAIGILVDRISKLFFLRHFDQVTVFKNRFFILDLHYTLNTGFAFSIPAPPFIILIITFFILVIVLIWWGMALYRQRPESFFFAAIIGGAIGNVVDRVLYKGVIDWIEIQWVFYSWSSFNIADIMIVIGVTGLLLLSFFSKKESSVCN